MRPDSIRRRVDEESLRLDRPDRSLTDRLIFWRDPPPPGHAGRPDPRSPAHPGERGARPRRRFGRNPGGAADQALLLGMARLLSPLRATRFTEARARAMPFASHQAPPGAPGGRDAGPPGAGAFRPPAYTSVSQHRCASPGASLAPSCGYARDHPPPYPLRRRRRRFDRRDARGRARADRPPPAAPARRPPLFGATQWTLPNGLTVALVESRRAPVVAQYLYYAAGGGEDPPGRSGVAHFLEHMMFKGSPNVASGHLFAPAWRGRAATTTPSPRATSPPTTSRSRPPACRWSWRWRPTASPPR